LKFQIEFQPSGMRLGCSEALTVLDAARQAGIALRADCGGEGVCGKCRVQVMDDYNDFHHSEAELKHLVEEERQQGFHLACELVVDQDVKIYIPPESISKDQVMQVEGMHANLGHDAAVRQVALTLEPATLHDLQSDFSRIKNIAGQPNLKIPMQTLYDVPELLRTNDWRINLIIRDDLIIKATRDPMDQLLGLAVDVGSTKIACYLLNLENGELLAAQGTPNPQIAYGEDIMARLAYAMRGETERKQLHTGVVSAINQTAETLCSRMGLSTQQIADLCLVGNTAMHHFFLDLPIGTLAVSPFTPVISDAIYPAADEFGFVSMPNAGLYVPAVIAGFVGSDHLAFLHSSGFNKPNGIRLGIDIGTNTEIALMKDERIVSVSTASGPAFEGAHIRYGMRAGPGAIEHVKITPDGSIQLDVIGAKAPMGICGSGILDVVAELRTAGWLNKRGRFSKDVPAVQMDIEGQTYIILAAGEKEVTLSQKDVDQVLLAKGAIRAGIDVLMDAMDVGVDDIEEVVIAGAFGSYMLPEQAVRLGMLPPVDLKKIKAVGNAAGTGARMMLASQSSRAEADVLAKRIEYLELTVYPDFPLFYARGISA